jgi:3-isopropylmalate/(R)-2-methylmalate dehydratase small subunit
MICRGRVWKFGDHVSTDIILPGSMTFSAADVSDEDASRQAMAALRPGWAAQIARGDILVAGRNFGCGSGRPAPRVLRALGIAAVIAQSLARQFFRNCIHVGLPALTCRDVCAVCEEGELLEVNWETGLIRNLNTGATAQAEPLPQGSPPQQILAAGGLEPFLAQLGVGKRSGAFHAGRSEPSAEEEAE